MKHTTKVPEAKEERDDVQVGIRFPYELWKRGKLACVDHDTTLQRLAVEGLEMRLNQLEKTNK